MTAGNVCNTLVWCNMSGHDMRQRPYDAENFVYDPRPNITEQRELRREYRALLATAQSMYDERAQVTYHKC